MIFKPFVSRKGAKTLRTTLVSHAPYRNVYLDFFAPLRLCVMKLFILIVLSTLLFPALVQAGIDYFSAANLRQFANHLYAQEDFPRAAGEYSRLLVAYPDSANTLDFDRLLSCYERSQQYDQALLASRFVPTDLFSQDCAWYYRKSTLFSAQLSTIRFKIGSIISRIAQVIRFRFYWAASHYVIRIGRLPAINFQDWMRIIWLVNDF